MFKNSLWTGVSGVVRRPGLTAVVFALNFLMAFVLSLPVYFILKAEAGGTGFGRDLAARYDLVLWADIMEKAGPLLLALLGQLLWIVPLYLIMKTAVQVGLIHALRGDQIRPFWQGVGRYTGRALLLALLFGLLLIVWVILTLVVAGLLAQLWPGEVGTFWVRLVFMPILLLTGFALLDLMHDYGRIALVVEDRSVREAWKVSQRWPFRHGLASGLYLAWCVVAALLLAVPFLLDAAFAAATVGAVWGLFLLQQFFLLLRAAVTVGWTGSEVALFEHLRLRETPLIAYEAEPATRVSANSS